MIGYICMFWDFEYFVLLTDSNLLFVNLMFFFYLFIQGLVSRMNVTGNINVKSFLSGNPVIKLALNEDLTLREHSHPKGDKTKLIAFFHKSIV